MIPTKRRRGELEELHYPALAQVRGAEIRAIGQRAHRLVGNSRDVITVFPGRVENPMILGNYLQLVFPRRSKLERRRLWASVPTGTGSTRSTVDGLTVLDMQLGWLAGGNQLGEVVAKRLGYLEEEGLHLEIHPGGPRIDGVSIVASRRYQLG